MNTARREVPADGAPPTFALLARGAAAAVRGVGRGGTVAGALPDVALVRSGIRPDVDRLAQYQELVGETVGDALPSGFCHVLAFPLAAAMLARADFPLPALGMVHVANRAELRRRVTLGEALDARVHAGNLAPHRRGATVDVVAELMVGDDVVWRGVSTYLAKGARVAGAPAPDAVERPMFEPPAPTGLWRFDRESGRRYAAVSGDHNPIHTSALAARAFGFPRPIAHGMLTAARALADVGTARGDAYAWAVEFASPVLLPAAVSVRIAPDGEGGFDVVGWSRSGRVHLTGTVAPLP